MSISADEVDALGQAVERLAEQIDAQEATGI